MVKKSKKPKPKTTKKPIKKGKTSKPKPRRNPNQVKRIPAKVGARSRSNITEVVAPSGARGGDGSYKTRSKEEIQAEKLQKARETLGIVDNTQLEIQQAPQRPVIQRQTGYVKPRNMEKFGGYSGIVEGYGVSNKDKKLDSKLEAMEKRLLNAVKNETTGKSSVNEDASKSRISGMIEEVSSRSLTDNEKIVQKKRELLQRRTRYIPPRNVRTPIAVSRDFTFYGSSLPTDAEVQKEKQEKDEKRKKLIKEGVEIENTRNVSSLLDNIVDNAINQSDIKSQKKIDADERSRILNQRSIEKNNRRLENIRNKEERDRAIEQQQILAKQNKEKQLKQEKQDVGNILSDIVDSSINISDDRTRKKSNAKEEEVRKPVGFNQQLNPKDIVKDFEKRNKQSSSFGDDDRINMKIGEIQDTQDDIDNTANKLIQVLDNEDDDNFKDVVDFEVPSNESINQPNPLTDFTPSGADELEDDVNFAVNDVNFDVNIEADRLVARANRPIERKEGGSRPLPERPLPVPPTKSIPTKRDIDIRKALEQSRLRGKEIVKLRKERQGMEAKQVSKNIVGDIADEAFSQSLINAEKREKEIKENERKQRDLQRQRTQEAKRKRQQAKNVSLQFSKNLLQSSIEGAAIKETSKDLVSGVIAGGLLKATQQDSGVSLSTSGRKTKSINVDDVITTWERRTPEGTDREKRKKDKDRQTIKADLELKNQIEKEKSEILQELLEFGLDGKILSFNANRFTPVRSQNEDTKLKKIVKDLMMEKQKQYPKELQNTIMVKIQSLLQTKYNLRQQQNKLRKYGNIFR